MKLNSFSLIKYSLVIVYIWFGALKVLAVSPVQNLVKWTYPSFPEPMFIMVLGIWEIAIGLLLLYKKTLRLGVLLMWIQMGGIFFGVILSPTYYFQNMNLLLLSANGEFVVKNLTLLGASYYLWEKTPKNKGIL
jgi:uncharacterized membrane protein YkgB